MDWTKDKKGNATSDDKPEDDFFAEAKKTAKIKGHVNVRVVATQNLIAKSGAAHILQGGFVHVHENNSKIIPPTLKALISKYQE